KVKDTNKGSNPQGQVTMTVQSCEAIDPTTGKASLDPRCDLNDPATYHLYYIKSNSISSLTLNGATYASFSAKSNVYELPTAANGWVKTGLDGGGLMLVTFTANGGADQNGVVCKSSTGCAALTVNKSTGGTWYSNSWGNA